MYFQVPQYIDIEDKIFGPLTFKQFIYLLGGIGGLFVLVKLLPDIIGFLIGIPIAVFGARLAFHKTNGRPFIHTVEAWVSYKLGSKLYLWKTRQVEQKEEKKETSKEEVDPFPYVPKLSQSKLKEMSWSLDILEQDKNKKQ